MIDIRATWDGDYFIPLQRFVKPCNDDLIVGRVYEIAIAEQRSMAAHKSYFAAVNDAFDNLPEGLQGKFRTPDKLRKHALVQTGFADEVSEIFPSEKIAQTAAALMTRALGDESVVVVEGNVVKAFTPKSQKVRGEGAMDAETFYASSNAVRQFLDDMIGVSAGC